MERSGSADFSWKDFVENIYRRDPEPTHTFSIEALEELPKDAMQKYLAYFLMYGAKTLYKKELAQLVPEEIDNLRRYLSSIGWKVNYTIETKQQNLDDNDKSKSTMVNYFLIDFTPAKRDELNDTNKPDRFA